MDNNNSDMNSHPPITDDDISKDVYDAHLGLADDEYHSNGALTNDHGQSHESTNQDLDITSSYPIADFYTYPDPPPFIEEGLPDEDWFQHFAPTTNHFQGHEDNGIMPSLENVDGNITSVPDTVHLDTSPQPTPPGPPHTANSLGPQTVQVPEPSSNDPNTMPSSAPQATASCPPPNNEGRNPDVREGRYNCTDCGTSSKTRRNHERHLKTKKHQKKTSNGSGSGSGSGSASPVPGFHCLAQGCEYSQEGGKSFTREDNLWRHMKTVHYIKARA